MTGKPSSTQPSEVSYFRGQVAPRAWRILRAPQLVISLIIGVAIGIVSPYLPIGDSSASSLSTAGLTFASVSFAACVAGAVLALTIPSTEFRSLTTRKNAKQKFSSYSTLIFTFTWSAFAQLGVVAASICGILFGADYLASPTDGPVINRVSLGVASALFSYAFLQLATVLTTISQIAAVLNAIDTTSSVENKDSSRAVNPPL